MEGAGAEGGGGAHGLRSTGKYRDERVLGFVRCQT